MTNDSASIMSVAECSPWEKKKKHTLASHPLCGYLQMSDGGAHYGQVETCWAEQLWMTLLPWSSSSDRDTAMMGKIASTSSLLSLCQTVSAGNWKLRCYDKQSAESIFIWIISHWNNIVRCAPCDWAKSKLNLKCHPEHFLMKAYLQYSCTRVLSQRDRRQ